jgi:hypothetical protein
MRTAMGSRNFFSFIASMLVGTALFYRMPFPGQNNLLGLIALQTPYLF